VLGLSKNEKKVKKGFKKVYATHIPGKLNDKMRML
jgi:hypothetical protein